MPVGSFCGGAGLSALSARGFDGGRLMPGEWGVCRKKASTTVDNGFSTHKALESCNIKLNSQNVVFGSFHYVQNGILRREGCKVLILYWL